MRGCFTKQLANKRNRQHGSLSVTSARECLRRPATELLTSRRTKTPMTRKTTLTTSRGRIGKRVSKSSCFCSLHVPSAYDATSVVAMTFPPTPETRLHTLKLSLAPASMSWQLVCVQRSSFIVALRRGRLVLFSFGTGMERQSEPYWTEFFGALSIFCYSSRLRVDIHLLSGRHVFGRMLSGVHYAVGRMGEGSLLSFEIGTYHLRC